MVINEKAKKAADVMEGVYGLWVTLFFVFLVIEFLNGTAKITIPEPAMIAIDFVAEFGAAAIALITMILQKKAVGTPIRKNSYFFSFVLFTICVVMDVCEIIFTLL